MQEEINPSAILILANGSRVILTIPDSNNVAPTMRFVHFPAPHKSARVAGYILNPTTKTIEESKTKQTGRK